MSVDPVLNLELYRRKSLSVTEKKALILEKEIMVENLGSVQRENGHQSRRSDNELR